MSAREFIDSNILIYLHDTTAGSKRDTANALMDRLWESGEGCVSVQVLQEFYVNGTRKLGMPSGEAEAQVSRLLAWTVHAPTPDDVLSAIRLHRTQQISFWDAMILTSASRLGCEVIWSEDLNPGQRYGGVRVQNPFA